MYEVGFIKVTGDFLSMKNYIMDKVRKAVGFVLYGVLGGGTSSLSIWT